MINKALISIVLAILMSAGIIFSADIKSVSAQTIPLSYEVRKDNFSNGLIIIDGDHYVKAVIEYSFRSNDILMSRLETVELIHDFIEYGTNRNHYTFTLPDEALSFKVWRVIDDNDYIRSLDGDNEFIHSPGTSIDEVETRLKTLYITDDLITKEGGYSETASVWIFKMHFNVEDAHGNKIPISRIHSLEVEYEIVKTFFRGLFTNRQYVHKKIEATETRNAMVWPYIIPQSVTLNIKQSYDSQNRFDWMVDLGSASVPRLTFSDVTIDKTSVLKISYYYQGQFFQDIDVVDEPYPGEDVIPVTPGTTDPLITLGQWFENLGQTLKFILIGIIVLVAIAILSFVFKAVGALKAIALAAYRMIILLFKLIKFIIIGIPKAIINFFVFLIVPKERRREQRHVSRYI